MFKKFFYFFFGKNRKKKPTGRQKAIDNPPVPVDVALLRLGMQVVKLDRPWVETPFLFQGFNIETEKQIRQLKQYCDFVYVAVEDVKNNNLIGKSTAIKEQPQEEEVEVQQKQVSFKHSYHNLLIGTPPTKKESFETEIQQAELNYHDASTMLEEAMKNVAKGRGVDKIEAEEAVFSCVQSVLHTPDTLLWLSQLKKAHKYTSQHSLNVSILSIVLGRHIDLPSKELTTVGLCGLMHDMGKILVPPHILDKPGELDFDERKIMQSHTTLGYELLSSSTNMNPAAVAAARDHHERVDGRGYARQLDRHKLSYYTNIVAIADMYDAITSDRVYQKGRTHLEALQIMSGLSGKHLDKELLMKFIQSIGVYPPGVFVEMTNGYIAKVIETNLRTKLRPKILLVLDQNKQTLPDQKILDLSLMPKDHEDNVFTIRSTIRPEDHQINNDSFYNNQYMEKAFFDCQ